MLRKPLLSLLLVLALGVLFVGGLSRLFVLRYESGDIYPPYSTLRADPLGTKALAAALEELPGLEVQRNFKPLPKLRPKGPVTLVYAGVERQSYWTDPELLAFDSMVTGGSRAVFTFYPVEKPPTKKEEIWFNLKQHDKKKEKNESEKDREKPIGEKQQKLKASPGPAEARDKKPADAKPPAKDAKDGKGATKGAKDTKKEDKDKSSDDDPLSEKLISFDTVAKRWGFGFGYLPEEKGKSYYRHAALVEPGGHLESDISWHSALYFRDLKPEWRVLYICGKMPVVIERKFGAGSIVLAADSFFLSNEALRGERHPLLISRLFSGPGEIVFDEEHNGLRENPGIASLARKYRLHGVIAGFLLLAILFVWKNAVRFVPAYPSITTEGDVIEGKESGEGFINLLRRTISPATILEICMSEWRKAFVQKPRERAKAEEAWAAEQTRPSRERDAVATYRAISRALVRKV